MAGVADRKRIAGKEGKEFLRKKLHSSRVCLFGVRCNYGTDDPFFLAVFAIAVRCTWLAYGIFCISYYFIQPGCADPQFPTLLTASLIGILALHVIILLVFIAVAIISNLGSLARPQPRKKNVFMLHVLLISLVVEVGWLAFSTYVAAKDLDSLSNCPAFHQVVILFYVCVGSSWIINFLLLLLFLIGLDPAGCCTTVGLLNHIKTIKTHENQSKILDLQCSLEDFNESIPQQGLYGNSTNFHEVSDTLLQPRLCCGRTNFSCRTAINDVVKVIGVLFGDFDVTFSDLATGLLLAGHYQRELYKLGKRPELELTEATVKLLKKNGSIPQGYKTPDPIPLTQQEFNELSVKCRTYMQYSLAVHGGIYTIINSSANDAWRLFKSARGFVCYPYFHTEHYEGDSVFTNTFVIATILNIPHRNIVTASFVNTVYKVPYLVTYDPNKKELVIAIRGSLSIQDALTDLSVAFVKVPGGLLGLEDAYVHRGFFESAVFVYKSLEACERFTSILDNNGVNKFVITGHSLGAGVASVLTVFFKDRHKDKPWIDKVEAFLFATPGAVMNYSLAEKTNDFMVSVVASNDVVPRASIRSVGYLRLMVEALLNNTRTSKSNVFCCVGGASCQCCPPVVPLNEHLVDLNNEANPSLGEDEDEVHEQLQNYLPFTVLHPRWKQSNSRKVIDDFIHRIRKTKGGAYEDPNQPMMFMAGRVLHLEELEQYSMCGGDSNAIVTGSWKARESLSTILVHPDMTNDHFPRRYISHCKRFSFQ